MRTRGLIDYFLAKKTNGAMLATTKKNILCSCLGTFVCWGGKEKTLPRGGKPVFSLSTSDKRYKYRGPSCVEQGGDIFPGWNFCDWSFISIPHFYFNGFKLGELLVGFFLCVLNFFKMGFIFILFFQARVK